MKRIRYRAILSRTWMKNVSVSRVRKERGRREKQQRMRKHWLKWCWTLSSTRGKNVWVRKYNAPVNMNKMTIVQVSAWVKMKTSRRKQKSVLRSVIMRPQSQDFQANPLPWRSCRRKECKSSTMRDRLRCSKSKLIKKSQASISPSLFGISSTWKMYS